jgi:hypothetical protein
LLTASALMFTERLIVRTSDTKFLASAIEADPPDELDEEELLEPEDELLELDEDVLELADELLELELEDELLLELELDEPPLEGGQLSPGHQLPPAVFTV